MKQWWKEYIHDRNNIIVNEDVPTMVQLALHYNEGQLSTEGALVIRTGKFTGRAAEDKYVVRDNYTETRINWPKVRSLSDRQFENIKHELVKHINDYSRTVYVSERCAAANSNYSLGLRCITTRASHALFVHNMFRESIPNPHFGHFTIIHAPDLELDYARLGLRSSTLIAIDFEAREILISGTAYAGELKKSVFSVMNTLLPDEGVLPMHSGANIDPNENVSIFFGLSGTGKTTLSTDFDKKLIGDDEHALTPEGVFNMEGGCYAKTYRLSNIKEPQIYKAVNRFGTLIENVTLDDSHQPLFDDTSITENGRASYPLKFIENIVESGVAGYPKNIFFLSADAMGVLPPLAKLTTEQVMFYFLLGYTAKLAGTEVGVQGVKATFSHCFGAPFMMRNPMDYARLFQKYLQMNNTNVWLINTGWYGGYYGGEGKRYELSFTRSLIRAIQSGKDLNTSYYEEPVFNLNIPQAIPGVEKNLLNPRLTWKDEKSYDEIALKLKELFIENYRNINGEVSSIYHHP